MSEDSIMLLIILGCPALFFAVGTILCMIFQHRENMENLRRKQ